jgi:hypothetical protein
MPKTILITGATGNISSGIIAGRPSPLKALGCDTIGTGIEGGEAHLGILRDGVEAPAHGLKASLAVLGGDRRKHFCRRHVPARRVIMGTTSWSLRSILISE